jgi:hypothetical protein
MDASFYKQIASTRLTLPEAGIAIPCLPDDAVSQAWVFGLTCRIPPLKGVRGMFSLAVVDL